MTQNLLSIKKRNKRKNFKISTRKMEWLSAGGKDPLKWKTNFSRISYCRRPKCKRKLTWGDRSYEFDHKDNINSNNSQRNCYLVCKICHSKATVIKKKKVRDKLTGMTTGYKTIKMKTGYKKPLKRKVTKKKLNKRKSPKNNYWVTPIINKKEKIKSFFGF